MRQDDGSTEKRTANFQEKPETLMNIIVIERL